MLLRFGDTSELDLGACARHKDNIDEGEILDLFEDHSWFVAEASVFGHLCQRFPKHVGKEADHDVSLNAIFLTGGDIIEQNIVLDMKEFSQALFQVLLEIIFVDQKLVQCAVEAISSSGMPKRSGMALLP